MKQNLFQCLFVAALASSPLVAKAQPSSHKEQSAHPSFHKFTGKILGKKVRLRLQPNLDGHIVKELNKGDIFAVVAENNGYYGIVPSNDMKAYVYKTYVLDNRVDAEHVNVRLEPSVDAPIVAQLNSGDPVNVRPNSSHPKWYEMQFPKDVCFWVAKEYIEKIGPVEYVEKYHERQNEAEQLLETAKLIKETEFRKEFVEIDLQRLTQNFMKVKRDFPDLEDVQAKADDAITKLQKEYCDLKIAFLENKAGNAVNALETLNAKLSTKEQAAFEEEAVFKDHEISVTQLSLDFPEKQTDKMKVWQPVEFSEFQAWASDHPEGSLENFYGEQAINADKLSGMVEPFNTLLKHKPGDYVLTNNGQTVAYLYSTHVNLQDLVGKKVTLKVAPRDNRNFAFPAYYVLEVQN